MNENQLALKNTFLNIEEENNNENYTLIEIANKKYAIKTENVLEIVKIIELEFPDKLPDCILGMINYEDKPVGVIDLREIFKNERIVYDLNTKIIVIKLKSQVTAIVCDNVIDITKLNKNKIYPLPYQKDTDFYQGIYTKSDKTNIYVLDMENIVKYIENNRESFNNDGSGRNYLVGDEESIEILKERRSFLIKVTQELQNNTPLYDMGVSFIINDVKYYITMASVKEFHKVNNSKFIKVPNTPAYIKGLINIKGDYTTVLDIRKFFNTSATKIKEKSTIIILNSNEFKIGILADEICENMNIDFEEILQNRLQKDDNKMLEFVKDGEIYQVLDVEKLFQDERLTIA
ncbi:MAG: chemotaxis protein CheW [Candidatus Gastranaerophilales bacterium]|nr:chemotaxis protein CheW [Candidatus Gastranaerophilales bacterium]